MGFKKELKKFIQDMLSRNDVYFVTSLQVKLGYPMDAKPHRDDRPQGLHRVEREVRREGPALLLPAQPLPSEHSWAARHHPPPAHLHGVPQQLSLDPRSNRRWLQFLIISVSSVSKVILRTEKLLFITSNIFYK